MKNQLLSTEDREALILKIEDLRNNYEHKTMQAITAIHRDDPRFGDYTVKQLKSCYQNHKTKVLNRLARLEAIKQKAREKKTSDANVVTEIAVVERKPEFLSVVKCVSSGDVHKLTSVILDGANGKIVVFNHEGKTFIVEL